MAAPRRKLGLTRLDDRCTPAGLDPAFGTGGTALIDLGGYDTATTAFVQPDGKIVALGSTAAAGYSPTQAVLIRLNADGSRDTSFDGDGVVPVAGMVYGGGLGYGAYNVSVRRLADGDYLVVTAEAKYPDPVPAPLPGEPPATSVVPSGKLVLTLARYNADGSTDSVRTLDLAPDAMVSGSLLARDDGSVLFATPASDPPTAAGRGAGRPRAEVRRVTPLGELDPSFGTDGVLTIDLSATSPDQAASVQLLDSPGGRVIVTGTISSLFYPAAGGTPGSTPAPGTAPGLTFAASQTTVYAARVNADGTRDTGYGTGGLFTLKLPDVSTTANAATVAADGALLLTFNSYNIALANTAAHSMPAYPSGPTVRRVTPDGVLDAGYAGDGTLELTSPHLQPGYVRGQYTYSTGTGLTPTADGGAFLLLSRYDGLFLQKLTATGEVDPKYGDDGLLFLGTPTELVRYPVTAAVAPDGDVVLVGWQTPQTPWTPMPMPVATATTPAPVPPTLTVPPQADLVAQRIAADAETPPLPPLPTPNPPPPVPPPGPDCTGDGVGDVLTVVGSKLQLADGATGKVLVSDFAPYEDTFTGGLLTAFADLDGDGTAEIVVAPDVGGGARIQVLSWDGEKLVVKDNFFAIDDPAFRGGARVACGDLNGDGTADVIVTAGPGGGPRVAVFDGHGLTRMRAAPPKLVADFFAFPGADAARLRDGATVAAGDLNGDGRADLVFGAGPGGAPRVVVLAGDLVAAGRVGDAQASPLANFYSGGDSDSRGGTRLALSDANGDGRPDLTVTNVATGAMWEYGGSGIPGAAGEPPGRRIDPVALPAGGIAQG